MSLYNSTEQSFWESSLKELQNCILCIIRAWSLFCSVRVYIATSAFSVYSFGKTRFSSFCVLIFHVCISGSSISLVLVFIFSVLCFEFNFISKDLTLFRIGFSGAAHEWGGWRGGGRGQKASPPFWNLSHISYNDENWHSYTLRKEDPKNIWITWYTPWVLLTLAFFHWKSA